MSDRAVSRVGGILLARLDSSRLPGKQLRQAYGRPLLDWLLERVNRIEGLDEIVIATTNRSVDTPLVEFAQRRGFPIFTGPASDVAGRVLRCARERAYDAWVRINGDSPLLDYQLFSRAINEFRSGTWDIVTNVLERTYPVGNSVEVFDCKVFGVGYQHMTDPRHFEHVTLYFYEHAEDYNILNLRRTGEPLRSISLAVDTASDFERFAWMLEQVAGDHLPLVGSAAVDLALQHKEKEVGGGGR